MGVIHVSIGEVKIARKGETLSAVLGSCIGIGILWPQNKICGLSHSLLSQAPTKNFDISARYVSQAIPSLLSLMKIKKENFPELTAIVAGGGNMLYNQYDSKQAPIGAQNAEVAFKILSELGIQITYSECGGEQGRKIIIDSLLYEYKILKIPKISKVGNL